MPLSTTAQEYTALIYVKIPAKNLLVGIYTGVLESPTCSLYALF